MIQTSSNPRCRSRDSCYVIQRSTKHHCSADAIVILPKVCDAHLLTVIGHILIGAVAHLITESAYHPPVMALA